MSLSLSSSRPDFVLKPPPKVLWRHQRGRLACLLHTSFSALQAHRRHPSHEVLNTLGGRWVRMDTADLAVAAERGRPLACDTCQAPARAS